MINIQDITSANLRKSKYRKEFPEFYLLGNFIENNPWHHNQNILEHTIQVFEALEHITAFVDFNAVTKEYLHSYMAQIIGGTSRTNILKVAALLHDIAKPDTLTLTDGITRCPGHELIAAGRIHIYAKRFNLDKASCVYIERIVRYHGFISEILNLMLINGNKEKYFILFKDTVGDIEIELLFLMCADLLGCDLKKTDKKDFDERMSLLSWMLDQHIAS